MRGSVLHEATESISNKNEVDFNKFWIRFIRPEDFTKIKQKKGILVQYIKDCFSFMSNTKGVIFEGS
jgi:hypothetical protein